MHQPDSTGEELTASHVYTKRGMRLAQRYLPGSWLPAMVDGFTRTISVRFLPMFPACA